MGRWKHHSVSWESLLNCIETLSRIISDISVKFHNHINNLLVVCSVSFCFSVKKIYGLSYTFLRTCVYFCCLWVSDLIDRNLKLFQCWARLRFTFVLRLVVLTIYLSCFIFKIKLTTENSWGKYSLTSEFHEDSYFTITVAKNVFFESNT